MTDIFGETIRIANASLVSYSTEVTLAKAQEMFLTTGLTLEKLKLVVLCVGHSDARLDLKLFKREYKQFMDSIRNVNNSVTFILCSMVPLKWNRDLFAVLRNRSRWIKDRCGVDNDRSEKVFFLDMYNKLQIQGKVPPEYTRSERLNHLGIKVFCRILGHKISAIKALWPDSDQGGRINPKVS